MTNAFKRRLIITFFIASFLGAMAYLFGLVDDKSVIFWAGISSIAWNFLRYDYRIYEE